MEQAADVSTVIAPLKTALIGRQKRIGAEIVDIITNFGK